MSLWGLSTAFDILACIGGLTTSVVPAEEFKAVIALLCQSGTAQADREVAPQLSTVHSG